VNRILVFFLAALHIVFVYSANAAVFERDWQTPDDGLLTYDDVNRREWLDVSQSLLIQFPGSTLEQRYQSALAELAPGGMFEGFREEKGVRTIYLTYDGIWCNLTRCLDLYDRSMTG
jgi:hypothetical protein